ATVMHREPAGHGHHIAIEAVVRAPADRYTLTPLRAFSKMELLANAGLVAHCSACLMSMMAAWCAASWRTLMRDCLHCRAHGFNVGADHVGGFARRLDIGSVLRRDLLAVVPHHGREFDHFLAQLAAYVLSTFPDRGKQCLTLSDHLLRRFVGL